MGAVSDSGNVTNKSESTQDVSSSTVTQKRKKSQIEQERIWQFFGEKLSPSTPSSHWSSVSDIRYQLESMESQLRLYDNQVDYIPSI